MPDGGTRRLVAREPQSAIKQAAGEQGCTWRNFGRQGGQQGYFLSRGEETRAREVVAEGRKEASEAARCSEGPKVRDPGADRGALLGKGGLLCSGPHNQGLRIAPRGDGALLPRAGRAALSRSPTSPGKAL